MDDSQATRHSLLVRIRDTRDCQAWEQFVEIYSPVVYRYLQRRGLQDADAADVTQEVLRTVVRSADAFEHGGHPRSFRKWLMSVAHSRLCDFLARSSKQVTGSGDTRAQQVLEEQPSADNHEDPLEHDYRKSLFQWAVTRIQGAFQESTWQAFWRTYVDGVDCPEVGQELGMAVEAVYMARSRVLARLRKEICQAEEQT
jgi:RNA polymerase sigma-70 factor (ECF subfamily)